MARPFAPLLVCGLQLAPSKGCPDRIFTGQTSHLELCVWKAEDGWRWDLSLVGRNYHRAISERSHSRRGLATRAAAARELEARIRLITIGLAELWGTLPKRGRKSRKGRR